MSREAAFIGQILTHIPDPPMTLTANRLGGAREFVSSAPQEYHRASSSQKPFLKESLEKQV